MGSEMCIRDRTSTVEMAPSIVGLASVVGSRTGAPGDRAREEDIAMDYNIEQEVKYMKGNMKKKKQ